MPFIYTSTSPEYLHVLQSKTISMCAKAWHYAYVHVLQHKANRVAVEEGWMNFEDSTRHFTVNNRHNWHSEDIPDEWHSNPKDVLEFWSYVKYFCDLVLNYEVFYLNIGGPGTDGGFGIELASSINVAALVVPSLSFPKRSCCFDC